MNLDNLTEAEIRKKAELYEKLRRMSPREFARLYERHITGTELFDDLLDEWPE